MAEILLMLLSQSSHLLYVSADGVKSYYEYVTTGYYKIGAQPVSVQLIVVTNATSMSPFSPIMHRRSGLTHCKASIKMGLLEFSRSIMLVKQSFKDPSSSELQLHLLRISLSLLKEINHQISLRQIKFVVNHLWKEVARIFKFFQREYLSLLL